MGLHSKQLLKLEENKKLENCNSKTTNCRQTNPNLNNMS
jgi:hypothetical protein